MTADLPEPHARHGFVQSHRTNFALDASAPQGSSDNKSTLLVGAKSRQRQSYTTRPAITVTTACRLRSASAA